MKTKKILAVVLLVLTTSFVSAQKYNQPEIITKSKFSKIFPEYNAWYAMGRYEDSLVIWHPKEGLIIKEDDIYIDENKFTFFCFSNKKNTILYGSDFLFIFEPSEWQTINLYKPVSMEEFYKAIQNHNINASIQSYYSLPDFDIKKINTSSFYTEQTKNGNISYIADFLNVLLVSQIGESEYILHTPWVPGKENNSSGIGEYLEIEFTEPKDNLVVLNGYVDLEKRYLYKANNRVKSAVITSLDEENPFEVEYEFEDYVHFSEIDFPCEVSKVRFTIKEVYKGEKWDDTCITAVITRWESEYSSIPN